MTTRTHTHHHGEHAAHTGHADHGHHAGRTAPAAHAGHGDHAAHGGAAPGGLQITQDGYTLELAEPITGAGEIDFLFRVLGPDGKPVTDYSALHDRDLHLIVVRRELTGFWHVHPELGADGTWSVRLNLPEAGAYRVFADIAPRALGKTLTLGADLAVAGQYAPRPAGIPWRIPRPPGT